MSDRGNVLRIDPKTADKIVVNTAIFCLVSKYFQSRLQNLPLAAY